jgi:hypothetical protein
MEAVGMPTKVSPPTKKSFILDATKLYMKNFTGLPYLVDGYPNRWDGQKFLATTNSTADVLLKSYSIPSSTSVASYGPYRLVVSVRWEIPDSATGAITVYANGILIGTKQYGSGAYYQTDTFRYDNFPFTPGQTLNVQIYGHTNDPNNPLGIYHVVIALAFAIQNSPDGTTAVWNKVGTVSISKSDYSVINELGDKINYKLGVRFWVVGEGVANQSNGVLYPNCDYKTSTGGEIFVNKTQNPSSSEQRPFGPLYWGYMPIAEGSFDIYVANYSVGTAVYIYAVLASIQPMPYFDYLVNPQTYNNYTPLYGKYHIELGTGLMGVVVYDIRELEVDLYGAQGIPFPTLFYYIPQNDYFNEMLFNHSQIRLDTDGVFSSYSYYRSIGIVPNAKLLFDLEYEDVAVYYIRIDVIGVS